MNMFRALPPLVTFETDFLSFLECSQSVFMLGSHTSYSVLGNVREKSLMKAFRHLLFLRGSLFLVMVEEKVIVFLRGSLCVCFPLGR